jgi:hypothetical protein
MLDLLGGLGEYIGPENVDPLSDRLLRKTLERHQGSFVRAVTIVRKYTQGVKIDIFFEHVDSEEKLLLSGRFRNPEFALMPQSIKIQAILKGSGLIV